MGGGAVTGDCDVGDGAVAAGSGVGDDGNTGDCDGGDGAVLAGGGSGEDISGEACVHPADSNITSVSGIRIRDSFFIFNPPSLSPVGYSLFSITTIYNVRLRY